MQRVCVLLLSFAGFSSYAAPLASSSIKLATFDGAKGRTPRFGVHKTFNAYGFDEGTTFKWMALNDPVMGGASTSTFAVEAGVGVFNGTCRVVSFLHAPGFAKVQDVKCCDTSSSQSQHMRESAPLCARPPRRTGGSTTTSLLM